ncbi:MAG: ABC transporter ATP-binding protein [Lachnospirales bacterium]
MSIIKLVNLKKIYRIGEEKIESLKGINLELEEGKIYCILGTSGSGKTTLLNMMAGLERASAGEIYIKDAPLHRMSEKELTIFRKKNVGFVFQSYNLMENMTALENVTLPLIFQKKSKKIRVKESAKILKEVGLSDRLHHKPTQLSGGQQQRVGIARAFVNNPHIIFADEPTGNLDTKTSEEMMELFVRLVKEHNQTLIMVTHDTYTSTYADSIINIKDGEITSITKNANKHD